MHVESHSETIPFVQVSATKISKSIKDRISRVEILFTSTTFALCTVLSLEYCFLEVQRRQKTLLLTAYAFTLYVIHHSKYPIQDPILFWFLSASLLLAIVEYDSNKIISDYVNIFDTSHLLSETSHPFRFELAGHVSTFTTMLLEITLFFWWIAAIFPIQMKIPSKISISISALLYILLHAIHQPIQQSCHRLYIPMEVFFSLLLEVTLQISASETASLFCGHSLISAGYAKLSNGASAWLSGKTITQFTNGKIMFPSVAGPGAILFEVFAPMLLFGNFEMRCVFVLGACLLHLSISVFMVQPSYEPQSIAYFLVLRRIPKRYTKRTKVALVIISCLLFFVSVTHRDEWPFTYVPMYSCVHVWGKTIDSAKQTAKDLYFTQWLGFISRTPINVRCNKGKKSSKSAWDQEIEKKFLLRGVGQSLVYPRHSNKYLDAVGKMNCEEYATFSLCIKGSVKRFTIQHFRKDINYYHLDDFI